MRYTLVGDSGLRVSRVDLGFRHDFVRDSSIQHITDGRTRGSIDVPPGRRRI
jgi:hypothetical protein